MSAQVADASRLYAAIAPTYDDETKYITGIRKRAIDALRLQPGGNSTRRRLWNRLVPASALIIGARKRARNRL